MHRDNELYEVMDTRVGFVLQESEKGTRVRKNTCLNSGDREEWEEWDWLKKETWRQEERYTCQKRRTRSVNCENQWRKEECTVVVANEGHVDCLYFEECDCETLTV